MKKLVLTLSLLLILLNGCGIFNKKIQEIAPPAAATNARIVVDPKLLEPCQLLPALIASSYEQVAEHYLTTIGLYGQCALKQLDSINAIRKLSNLDKP
jgi:hypothetical protein